MFRVQASQKKLEEKLEASTSHVDGHEMTFSTAGTWQKEEYQSASEVREAD